MSFNLFWGKAEGTCSGTCKLLIVLLNDWQSDTFSIPISCEYKNRILKVKKTSLQALHANKVILNS